MDGPVGAWVHGPSGMEAGLMALASQEGRKVSWTTRLKMPAGLRGKEGELGHGKGEERRGCGPRKK